MNKTFNDIIIKSIKGIEFDEILAWTVSPTEGATVRYRIGDKERLASLESEAIEIEFKTDV